jgi:hypothetical protein
MCRKRRRCASSWPQSSSFRRMKRITRVPSGSRSSWNPPLPHGPRESLFAAGRLSVTSTGTTSSPFKVETVQPTIVMNFMIKR